MKKWRGFKLNRSGKKLFLQAYILMMLIRLGLLLLPFRRLQDLILKVKRFESIAAGDSQPSLGAIAQSVHRSARYSPGKVMCLAKALTTAVMMSIYGFPYKIKFGVAKGESNNIEAHAWVESEGKVVVGYLPDLSRYTAMSSTGEGLII